MTRGEIPEGGHYGRGQALRRNLSQRGALGETGRRGLAPVSGLDKASETSPRTAYSSRSAHRHPQRLRDPWLARSYTRSSPASRHIPAVPACGS